MLKCFGYVLLLGMCQVFSSSISSENVLISTALGDIIFIGAVVILLRVFNKNVSDRLKLNKITFKTTIIVVLVSLLLNFLFQSVQFLFSEAMRNDLALEMSSELYEMNSLLGFITVVIIAPFSEEILFRGLILEELKNTFSVHLAIVLQAVLFGIIHGNIIWGIVAFLSAMLYGYFVKRYQSIFPSVFGHMSVNLLSFVCGV